MSVAASVVTVHPYATLYTVGIASINSGNALLFTANSQFAKRCLQITLDLFASFTTNKPPKTQVNMSILFIVAVYF